jgi:hypothetical protein
VFRGPGEVNALPPEDCRFGSGAALTRKASRREEQPHASRRNSEGAKMDASHLFPEKFAEMSQIPFVGFCRIL